MAVSRTPEQWDRVWECINAWKEQHKLKVFIVEHETKERLPIFPFDFHLCFPQSTAAIENDLAYIELRIPVGIPESHAAEMYAWASLMYQHIRSQVRNDIANSSKVDAE